MSKIKILPQHIINQIAAGEVVERPSSIIKELMENSIDSLASKVEVEIVDGGKSFIAVKDDGFGIEKDDLNKVFLPNATSKIPEFDLFNIDTMGFRGEALSSISSVARVVVKSSFKGMEGFEISSEGGEVSKIFPSPIKKGTQVEVRDLFFNIPARLKFMRSIITEQNAAYNIFKNVALAHPNISFILKNKNKIVYNFQTANVSERENIKKRINDILGEDFINNSHIVSGNYNGLKLYGLTCLPTFSEITIKKQFFIVNHRCVEDALLRSAVYSVYRKVMPTERKAVCVLYLSVPFKEIDVNVHPAKLQIKFKNAQDVRGFVYSHLKGVIEKPENQKTATTLFNSLALNKFASQDSLLNRAKKNKDDLTNNMYEVYENKGTFYISDNVAVENFSTDVAITEKLDIEEKDFLLGFAKAQYHKNWIVAQNKNGLVIVDQHAAHERITQEKILKELGDTGKVSKQMLLVPYIAKFDKAEMLIFDKNKTLLSKYGLDIDIFGEESIVVRALPAILSDKIDMATLLKDLVVDLQENAEPMALEKRITEIYGTIACHSSIRSGRELTLNDMNELLRLMENTPNVAQCSHGRPTWVEIPLKDIEKLFGRR